MSKPAARIGDMHSCPMVTPGTGVPHVGGVIIGPGCGTVLIEGLPAATIGDACTCVGEPDMITGGASGVFIEGIPAARNSDLCQHGGKIARKKGTVLIGGPVISNHSTQIEKLSVEKKNKAISQTIERCNCMLGEKLKLLIAEDTNTLNSFKKWFGNNDQESRAIIIDRINKMLNTSGTLSVSNFKQKTFAEEEKAEFATIYPDDPSFTIFMGVNFWKAPTYGHDSRGGILSHELSHSNSIGKTVDYVRGEGDCILLAKTDPKDALYNADSFEYFLED